jgi:DUF1365 family protein
LIVSCVARPLRDDEVLPVRQHRIVPSGAMATEEEEVRKNITKHFFISPFTYPFCTEM